jgi:ArsR family transcriptional regulator
MAMYAAAETMIHNLETILEATADRTRLRILGLLPRTGVCVCQLVAVLGLSQPTVSKHLALLRRAGLIEAERRGRWVHYRRARAAPGDPRANLLRLIDREALRDVQLRRDRRLLASPHVRRLAAACPPTSRRAPGARRGR